MESVYSQVGHHYLFLHQHFHSCSLSWWESICSNFLEQLSSASLQGDYDRFPQQCDCQSQRTPWPLLHQDVDIPHLHSPCARSYSSCSLLQGGKLAGHHYPARSQWFFWSSAKTVLVRGSRWHSVPVPWTAYFPLNLF